MDAEEFIPVHIGLMGHIDAGKTAIARNLSSLISTAGLDKHSQSQERGITIDLGFTFFPLEEFMVTLVDAPGHADLIRSVVSGASIIDLGILVIDGSEGPQVQTGEHLIILDLMDIPNLVVLINKMDIIDDRQRNKVTAQIKAILKTTRFDAHHTIFHVSASAGTGFESVKQHILGYFKEHTIRRKTDPPFKFVFDHHFNKKGMGTILTGTVISGKATIGTELTILPTNVKTKIKSIQKSKKSVNTIRAGDRCGISVSEINPQQVYRGCFATDDSTKFNKGKFLDVEVKELEIFQPNTKFGMQVTVSLGMLTLTANIFPYKKLVYENETLRVRLEVGFKNKPYHALLWLSDDIFLQNGDKLLLTRLDLSPKSLRILGSAIITEVRSALPPLFRQKIKRGKVKNPTYSPNEAVVEGLVQSMAGGQTLIGKIAEPPFGKVVKTFGKNGNLVIQIAPGKTPEIPIEVGTPVEIMLYKSIKTLK